MAHVDLSLAQMANSDPSGAAAAGDGVPSERLPAEPLRDSEPPGTWLPGSASLSGVGLGVGVPGQPPGAFLPRPRAGADSSVELWAHAVSLAQEPCLVLDANGVIVAASAACGALFSMRLSDAVGRRLVDGVLSLLDFNQVSGQLPDWEVDKIPPLLALSSGGLARGLLRVHGEDGVSTVDAISTPLRDQDGVRVIGSLTFFAPVGR